MLRRYARAAYASARRKMATEAGVPLSRVRDRTGRENAIRRGFAEVKKWFDGLSEQMQGRVRVKLSPGLILDDVHKLWHDDNISEEGRGECDKK